MVIFPELKASLQREILSQTSEICLHAEKGKAAQRTNEGKGTGLAQPFCELMAGNEFGFCFYGILHTAEGKFKRYCLELRLGGRFHHDEGSKRAHVSVGLRLG